MGTTNTSTPQPDEITAANVFKSHFSDTISSVTRFPTGLCHYVYEVRTVTGRAYVVRIATAASRQSVEGGLYWHPRLQAAGVPVPALYASYLGEKDSYMLMERLPGTDLGQVYAGLSASEKQVLAMRMAAIQEAVGSLPMSRKFGFAYSYEHVDATGKRSWADVVAMDIARSEERIRGVGRIAPGFAERVRAAVGKYDPYFQGVKPVPFLDDTTTKNVIVDQGALSGIVDTDEVCFGDPIFTLGLTNMALLALGADTDYVGYWLDALDASRQQREMVVVYSLVFCLNFLGELGQVFNQRVEFSDARTDTLCGIFERLLGSLTKVD
jgi:aminoglycoside phosphotransferase (APT) family kinase protein